jgi:hypothetical protein
MAVPPGLGRSVTPRPGRLHNAGFFRDRLGKTRVRAASEVVLVPPGVSERFLGREVGLYWDTGNEPRGDVG